MVCAGHILHFHAALLKGGKGGALGGGPRPSRNAAPASSASFRRLALHPARKEVARQGRLGAPHVGMPHSPHVLQPCAGHAGPGGHPAGRQDVITAVCRPVCQLISIRPPGQSTWGLQPIGCNATLQLEGVAASRGVASVSCAASVCGPLLTGSAPPPGGPSPALPPAVG